VGLPYLPEICEKLAEYKKNSSLSNGKRHTSQRTGQTLGRRNQGTAHIDSHVSEEGKAQERDKEHFKPESWNVNEYKTGRNIQSPDSRLGIMTIEYTGIKQKSSPKNETRSSEDRKGRCSTEQRTVLSVKANLEFYRFCA
jgi:hypothetical protein